jgi:hypothetical protein
VNVIRESKDFLTNRATVAVLHRSLLVNKTKYMYMDQVRELVEILEGN